MTITPRLPNLPSNEMICNSVSFGWAQNFIDRFVTHASPIMWMKIPVIFIDLAFFCFFSGG